MYPRHYLSFESRVLKELPLDGILKSVQHQDNKNQDNKLNESVVYPDSFHMKKEEVEEITIIQE